MDIETPCKNCVLAVYNGRTQTGCQLDRVDQYRRVNKDDVVEAYDEDREFFVIKRLCMAHRDTGSPWLEKHIGMSQAAQAVAIRDEIRLKLDVVVVVNKTASSHDVYRTAVSLSCQQMPAASILVVTAPGNLPAKCITEIFQHYDLDHSVTVTIEENIVDAVVRHSHANWYGVFDAGFTIPRNFVAKIDWALNTGLQRFSYLSPYRGQGEVVQRWLHELCKGRSLVETEHGMRYSSLQSKVEHLATQWRKQFLIGRVEDVCPSLKDA